ncbi:class I SAM-dependent methyltransferase [Salegentibacter sp. JZCK2]|uniref:class I SAM-dependent methyltransferase n=1 Tax=Salegentibacter tibetensis TaxID=2873600 RepID=UPI001CCF0232|nr:class I SAM-dependent methyltransferase [Salegentibacter tibetensis]MBZ9729747.1 class I SAM-dependent methyltransferase [Salegentibacter tibetensis]
MRKKLKEILHLYRFGKRVKNDLFHKMGNDLIRLELTKRPSRTDVINYLMSISKRNALYLEIGVRFPEENFNKIGYSNKYGVDPGLENKTNPVDFKLTSDDFFEKIRMGDILRKSIKFDVIFIDGLHLADQVDRDIKNSLEFLKDGGFIVLHDCNPPSTFHASEIHDYKLSPAKGYWNGTTWKAFFKYRQYKNLFSCCIDSDWGIGVISKKINIGEPTRIENPFFEYKVLEKYRKESLNLMSFEEFKKEIAKSRVEY